MDGDEATVVVKAIEEDEKLHVVEEIT